MPTNLYHVSPKVVDTQEFRKKRGSVLKGVYAGIEEFIIVTNGTYANRSFAVVSLDFLMELARRKRPDIITFIEKVRGRLEATISEKYRQIRLRRRL